MRRLLLALLFCAACRTNGVGTCSSQANCPQGSVCDQSQSPAVCVVPQGACFPSCPSGQICKDAACAPAACDPPCNSSQLCDPATATCQPVTTASVQVTAPAGGGYAGASLQATAHAAAPGGVTSLRFEVRRGGTVLASAAGVETPAASGSYAATLDLSTAAEGMATLVAIATYGAAIELVSAPASLFIDLAAPSISLVTDGRSAWLAGGTTATVIANISDTGAGLAPGSVQLQLTGIPHAPIPGAPGATAGTYSFAIALDSSVAAPGTAPIVPFTLSASDLAGHTTTTSSGDPAEVLKVDRDAPAISINLPAADYTDAATGRGYYRNDAGPLAVTAQIADRAGVEVSSVCLQVAGESGCPHAGATLDGGFWTFAMPRPPASGAQDGTAPTGFTISAADTLAKTLDAGLAPEHRASAAGPPVYFDNVGPTISIGVDTRAYARQVPGGAADVVPVTAAISDTTGVVAASLTVGASTVAGVLDGGVYVFNLDATKAPAGAEGTLSFVITAKDNLGHVSLSDAGRFIDDAPPAATLSVFTPGNEPASPGLGYPAAIADTGYDGGTFIYSDVVHLKGTLADQGGLSATAAARIDGIELDGGVTTGAPIALGCTDGAKACAFDVTVALNAPGNGAFHTGLAVLPGPAKSRVPVGNMTVALTASDKATTAAGVPAANKASRALQPQVTRFLWTVALGDGAASITGLALHPDGDLIVTTVATAATPDGIWAVRTDGMLPDGGAPPPGAVHWSWGSDAGIGGATPFGTPSGVAVGAGDANGAVVYAASPNKSIFALNAAGAPLWHADNLGVFDAGIAVAPIAPAGGGTAEEVFAASNDTGTAPHLFGAWTAGGVVSTAKAALDSNDSVSAPLVVNGEVFLSTQNALAAFAEGDGTLGAQMSAGSALAPFLSPISDGTWVYAGQAVTNPSNGSIIQVSSSLAPGWTTSISPSPPSPQTALDITSEPTIDLQGALLVSDTGNFIDRISQSGSATHFIDAGAFANLNTKIPTVGSDGHLYVPRVTGYLYAFMPGGQPSWAFDPPNAILKATLVDCAGRVFTASGNALWALIGDDRGLGDTPWPSYRRDSRGTGNANGPRYGSRTASGCTP